MALLNVTNYNLEGGQLISAQVCSAAHQCVLVSHEDERQPGSATEHHQFIHVSPKG